MRLGLYYVHFVETDHQYILTLATYILFLKVTLCLVHVAQL